MFFVCDCQCVQFNVSDDAENPHRLSQLICTQCNKVWSFDRRGSIDEEPAIAHYTGLIDALVGDIL